MGGHAGGTRASAIARDTVRDQVSAGADLAEAVLAAHYAIRSAQRQAPELSDMGTTIVALAEHGDAYRVCWVGDSRAYRYSSENQHLEQLTSDHNVAGVLVASGALSADEATRHPQRHVLTDCLGLAGQEEPRIDILNGVWQPGELLLLCSDGLSGELGDVGIAQILRSANGAGTDRLVERLLQDSLAAGGRDNVSVIAVAAPDTLKPRRTCRIWPFGGRSRNEP